MHSYAIVCIAFLILFDESDCRLHRRSHLLRRQNEQVYQNPNQMMPNFYPVQQAPSQSPFMYQNPVPPNSGYPPYPYPAMPPMFSNNPGPAAYPNSNYNPVLNVPPVVTPTPLLQPPQYQNSSFQNSSQYPNQPPAGARRRRKDAAPVDKNMVETLLEKGSEILKTHPIGLGKEIQNDFLGDRETDRNTTVVPIPKGVQVKTISDDDENRVEKIVNISSTQRTISVDNNTEIENVVEMQMEKKLEDEKGDNKGSEEVRIVETELVKPLVKVKMSNRTQGHRRRRFRPWKFSAHRRSKRSEKDSEVARPSTLYGKMAKRFLSDLKRKEKIDERNAFSNRRDVSDPRESEFRSTKNNGKKGNEKSAKEDSLYDNDELGDFLKRFLDQLKKFKKIRENIGNRAQYMEFSNSTDSLFGFKETKPARKNRHREYPEHMKIVMNLNMTLDTKGKDQLIRSSNAPRMPRNAEGSLTATDGPVEQATRQMTLKVVFIGNEKEKESKFLTVILLLSVVIFLLPVLAWAFPKLYRTVRLDPRCSAARKYRFYHENGNEKAKELRHYRRENVCAEDYLQLEWQSENGDWLSEKEMDFK